MADFIGIQKTGLGDQAGYNNSRCTLPGVGSTASATRPTPPVTISLSTIAITKVGELNATGDNLIRRTPVLTMSGSKDIGPGHNWFERIHSYPSTIELGNILSTVVRDIEVYSSYRKTEQTLLTATNNAGTGITFIGLPTLPTSIPPNNGFVFQVQVSTQGQPTINGTLDFTTDIYPVSIAITGSRVVMIAYEPEGDIRETLEFMTGIIRSTNGREQRIKIRNNPRQILDYNYKVSGEERRKFEAFLYKWHPQTFGIPIWFESKRLTQPALAGDTTIYLDTRYASFRDQSLVILWRNYGTFDALEVSSFTDTSITLSSPLIHDYAVGDKVMPLRVGITKQEISGDKYIVNLHSQSIKFYVTDNESDIGDVSAFGVHNDKVMFSDYNWVSRETITDTLKNVLVKLDNKVGSPIQFSDWINSHFVSSKGFFCRNPKSVWEMKQVLHSLCGRQKSFYLPTFYPDIVVNQELTLGSYYMDIDNIRYTDFIGGNEPNKSLYIVLYDGTIITRQVTESEVIDDDTERLTVDIAWESTIPVSSIRGVSFLRLGRFSSDSFEINHNTSGQATLRATVQGVIQ